MLCNRGDVIVGVQDSLTGLRALREAVAAARRRGLELQAVRAYGPGWSGDVPPVTASGGPASEYGGVPLQRERVAAAVVERAFAEAMGGVPCDVQVRTAAVPGPVRSVLVGSVTGEHDLLVVGASRVRWWWPLRRSMGRYCARRAPCPVLVVPPHPGARELGGRRLAWRMRARRELAGLVT